MSLPDLPDEPELLIDTVSIIANAFQQKFGGGAIQAAEDQHYLASDESVGRWKEVIVKLKAI